MLNMGVVEEDVFAQEAVLKTHTCPPFSVELYTEFFESTLKFHIKRSRSMCIVNFDFVGVAC